MDNHNTLVHDYSRAFDRKALETLDDDALYSLNEVKYPEIAPHSCAFCQNLCIGPDKGGRELFKWEGDMKQYSRWPIVLKALSTAALSALI